MGWNATPSAAGGIDRTRGGRGGSDAEGSDDGGASPLHVHAFLRNPPRFPPAVHRAAGAPIIPLRASPRTASVTRNFAASSAAVKSNASRAIVVLLLSTLSGLAIAGTAVLVIMTLATDAPPAREVRILLDAASLDAAAVDREASAIARAVRAVPGVARVHTRSRAGQAIVTCIADGTRDEFAMRRDLSARLAALSLDDAVRPTLGALDGRDLRFTVDRDAPAEDVPQRISTLPGVLDVELCGARERTVRIDLDAARASAFGITLPDVTSALSPFHEMPAGIVAEQQLVVRGAPRDDASALARLRVGPVSLSDVATVSEALARGDCSAWSREGAVVVGRARVAEASIDSVNGSLRGIDGLHVFGSGARVTSATLLVAPGASDEDRARTLIEVARALGGVSGVTDVLVTDDGGAPEVSIAWSTREPVEAEHAALRQAATSPGVRLVPGNALHGYVIGDDRDQDREVARRACALVADRASVACEVVDGGLAPRLSMTIDSQRVAESGASMAEVRDALIALSDDGLAAGHTGDGRVIRVHIAGASLADPPSLRAVPIEVSNGAHLPLSELVSMSHETEPAMLDTIDGTPAIELAITAETDADTLRDVLAARLRLPAGVRVEVPDT